MKLILTEDLIPGMFVGAEVVDGKCIVKLLDKGACLTQSQIIKFQNWGVPFLYIDDETEKVKADANVTKEDFLRIYKQTIDDIANAFRYIKKFKEVPVIEMQELVDHKISLLIETIGVLDYLHEIRCHNEYTFQHSLNVAIIAGILGRWCKYRGAKLKNLILAGLLHDIGKLAVPLSILNKPGRLSLEEFEIIKRHSREGYRLVKNLQHIHNNIRLAILHHHERLDGSGYPLGLAGNEIHDGAKVIAIADIYDAMTSDRIYRNKETPLKALDVIADQMFGSLDINICLTFLDHMRDYLTGSSVVLSNGQQAKIIAFNTKNQYFTKPVVCIRNGTLLDLKKTQINIMEVN